MKALFDTNILIDYLNGIQNARDELARYPDRAISVVTWMEVLVGADADVADDTRRYLLSFQLIELDEAVAEEAVSLRRSHRMKLPDAIVWASARRHGMLLVTRNTKDFSPNEPGVRMPYRV